MADEETQQEQNVDATTNNNPDEAQIDEQDEVNKSNDNEDQQAVDTENNDNNDSNVNENVDNVDNIDNVDDANNENNDDDNDSDQDIIDASKDIKFKASENESNDVVVVEAKTDHDNALKQDQVNSTTSNKNINDEDDYKRETEVREIGIPNLITIRFDNDKYLGLKYKNEQFAFYQVRICCDTNKKTSWDLYLRYSDIDRFHTKLSYLHNRLCKFNPQAKKTLILPKIPPKKQWQRNKLDKNFINDRINLLNIYFNEVTKYVSKSTIKVQDLFLSFLEISNNLYKYVINNDTEMLNELLKYDQTILTSTYDENNSNIFHYATSQKNIDVINWLLTMIDDKKSVIQQLITSDQYHFTPITLAKYQNSDKIYEILTSFVGDENNEEEKQSNDDYDNDENKEQILPAQYKTNVLDESYKRLLWIIINPFSGTGQGISIWENLIKPFLDFNQDRISYETLITTKQFHAQQECEKLSSEHKYNGILCLGGDGTIAEVINGLYTNKNIGNGNNKLCITPIPGGSGNALAKELGMNNTLNGLKRLLKGFETCIDAYIASQVAEKDTYSFVSTQWGAISTIDLESESYRWMGSFRFTLKAVSEISWNVTYKARIYFKPINYDKAKQELEQSKDKIVDENDREINDDPNWWRKLPNLHLDEAEHKVEEVPLNDNNDTDKDKEDNNDNKNEEQKESSLLPTPYPSDWCCVQGEFGLCCVTNLQWIAEDSCMGGKDFDCKTNTLRLVYNKKTGRVDYASALLGLDSGKHLDLDFVKYFDVTHVVIQPLTKGPPIDVDGERKPLKPVYVKLLPSDFVVTC